MAQSLLIFRLAMLPIFQTDFERWTSEILMARWLRSRSRLLICGIVLAIGAIAMLSVHDVRRRNRQSLDDFGLHQERLARNIAAHLETQLFHRTNGASPDLRDALDTLRRLEEPGIWVALLWPPDAPGFVTTHGRPAPTQVLKDAIAQGHGYVRYMRELGPAIGLPLRTAVAGLAHFPDGRGRLYHVAVVATALRARDRADEASFRALLFVIIAAGAVLAFGGVALHWQRQDLRTQQALAVEEARRRREAELERASRAATLGTLAIGITHELSTPLGIITTRAEQLHTRLQNDQRLSRSVVAIKEQAARMSRVIRGILGLVRDQAPIAERMSPKDVCQNAIALVQHRYSETGVALTLDAPPEATRLLLRGDQRLLEQAVVNLLLNACDACNARGHVALQVVLLQQQILLRVIDDGAGISKEAAARATEPFFTTKPVGKGSGLGLAVTQEIVKSHRGALRIGPLPGGGTAAEILLPQSEEAIADGC